MTYRALILLVVAACTFSVFAAYMENRSLFREGVRVVRSADKAMAAVTRMELKNPSLSEGRRKALEAQLRSSKALAQ